MATCSGVHKERLFIGEAGFKGVYSLLEKHKDSHPNLGESIIATELLDFGRTAESCPKCSFEANLGTRITNLFLQDGESLAQDLNPKEEGIFCSQRCERISNLQDRGVTIILGFDGTKIHRSKHPSVKRKRFTRIHWNCPHDKSTYAAQTLPKIVKNFFKSASRVQERGGRIHITLAQPLRREPFYQSYVYNIRDAAKSSGYSLYGKRPFGNDRYPGYEHEITGQERSADAADKLREFVFIKGKAPRSRKKHEHSIFRHRLTRYEQDNYFSNDIEESRLYYYRDTDNESSDYSSEGD